MCGEVRKKGNAAYCSLACDVNFRWEQKKKEILHKIELGLAINPARLKKYLLEVRGNKCEICGISEYLDLPVLMIMDHINGDGLDNRLENLRLVCPICDTRLPTYKSKNYGKGRVKKRLHQQRVAESHRIP